MLSLRCQASDASELQKRTIYFGFAIDPKINFILKHYFIIRSMPKFMPNSSTILKDIQVLIMPIELFPLCYRF